MFEKNRRRRGWLVRMAVMAAIVLMIAIPAEARNNIRSAFFDVYPGAVGTVIEKITELEP